MLDGLCIEVSHGYNPKEIYAEQTKFVNLAEQEQALEIITSALKKFAGVSVGLADRDSVIRISGRLQGQISSGKLIKGQHSESREGRNNV